ncbi:MAG: hypothetical protein PHG91_05975 [Syntrophales bacterium]|nr:hypothetical protein [Syntrophales bacterium]MDD5531921.1 hypothetical protein [Syntrophales bacterium]
MKTSLLLSGIPKIRSFIYILAAFLTAAGAAIAPAEAGPAMPAAISRAMEQPALAGDASLGSLFPDELEIISKSGGNLDQKARLKLAAVRRDHAKALFRFHRSRQREDALELALRYANSARELDPSDPQGHLLAGIIYSEMGEYLFAGIKAVQSFERAVTLAPGVPSTRILLAFAYLKENDRDDALEQFEEALRLDSSLVSPRIVGPMNLCYIALGKTQIGEDFYRQLLAKRPETPYLALSRAVLLKHDRRLDEARGELNRVIGWRHASGEDKRYARELLRKIVEMEGGR